MVYILGHSSIMCCEGWDEATVSVLPSLEICPLQTATPGLETHLHALRPVTKAVLVS